MDHAFTTSIPHLETRRLVLREYRAEDFDAFVNHLADPESAAYFGLADRQTAWRIFCSHAGLWLIHGAGWWALEIKETGQLVGNVGAFFRESSPVMELGWNTYRPFWGHGFASEAAAGALDHAFAIRCEPKVQAHIAPGNQPSIRVARRLGLKFESVTELHGQAVGTYTRSR